MAENFDYSVSIEIDKTGHVYVAGISKTPNTGFDYDMIKYDTNGVQQWAARYNGGNNLAQEANAIAF